MENSDHTLRETRSAFFWTRLLNMPFWAIFNMLQMILYKDLHASAFQITILVALRPVASLFSPYWSQLVHQRPDRLVSNLVWANILKCLPFLLFPFVHHTWLFVISCALCMVFARGVIPAWMEIIKLNIRGKSRERVLAVGSFIEYVGSAIIPVLFGWILDDYEHAWRWILFGTALLGIFSTAVLYRIPIKMTVAESILPSTAKSFNQLLIQPWKQSWNLMKLRPDFAHFQIAFTLEGAGLIMIQTVLPMFFIDSLQLSYTEILVAITLCKAIGFSISSPIWVKYFSKINIYNFCSYVTILGAIFPILLMCATSNLAWMYIGYVVYGIMQAGSELGWHMSGPLFAKEHDSSLYSGTNILSVGIRGCVAPLLGYTIYTLTNSVTVLGAGVVLCLLATERMRYYSKKHFEVASEPVLETR